MDLDVWEIPLNSLTHSYAVKVSAVYWNVTEPSAIVVGGH